MLSLPRARVQSLLRKLRYPKHYSMGRGGGWGKESSCSLTVPLTIFYIHAFKPQMHTRGFRPQGHTNSSIHPCRRQFIPRALATLGDRVPLSLTHFHCCPRWLLLHCSSIPVKYGPFLGAAHTPGALIHYLLFSPSFIFLPSLAFDCFSGVYHIELLSLSRKPYSFFFPSLSQLISNRDSTALDRSTSCLLNRTAGSISWGPRPGPWRARRLSLGGERCGPSPCLGRGCQWGSRYLSCSPSYQTAAISQLSSIEGRGGCSLGVGGGSECQGTDREIEASHLSLSEGSGNRQVQVSALGCCLPVRPRAWDSLGAIRRKRICSLRIAVRIK